MFVLNSYLDKLYKIKWKFSADKKEEFEQFLLVKFKETEEGYYVINNVVYTILDILPGLEKLNFVISKVSNEIILEVLN